MKLFCAIASLGVATLALCGCEIRDEAASVSPATAAAANQSSAAFATNMRFVVGFQRGYEQAIAEGKPMLVFFTGRWCRYCHEMAAEALSDPDVRRLSERFVCIQVDADDEPNVCQQFQIRSFPTIQFLSRRGQLLERLVGKRPSSVVLHEMQAALDAVARTENAEDIVR
jgi:thioredoxin-like negative regulator of GroEL